MSPRNFKLIFLIYFLIQFVCPSSVNSQSQGGLNVGEKCPEIILKNIINHTSSKAKLSDFKGKKIILDFWATWCNPCLKNLPKMEALQKKYQSEIKVFLIGEDSKKNIERFYSDNKDFSLPSTVFDSITEKKFPHISLPHYVWIDSNKTVTAITGGDEITETNIKNWIRGVKINLPVKNDWKTGQVSFEFDNVKDQLRALKSAEAGTLFKSQVSSRPGLRMMGWNNASVFDSASGRKPWEKVFYVEYPLYGLIVMSYSGLDASKQVANRMFVEIKDSIFNRQNIDQDPQFEFLRRKYTYQLIVPPGYGDSLSVVTQMQNDLQKSFKIKTGWYSRKIKCWVISAPDPKKLESRSNNYVSRGDAYGITLENCPIEDFFIYLEKSKFSRQPILNETGIKGKIDLEIKNKFDDKIAFINELKEKGITIVEEERIMNCLIISY